MSEPANKPENKQKLHPAMEAVKWQPGQSGNPSGRPKKKPISDLYEEILNDEAEVAKIRTAVIKALTKGNMAMVLQLKEMTDRVEGKVAQPVDGKLEVSMSLAQMMAEAEERLNDTSQ